MDVLRINTTAFQEEDFHLLTTLTDKQIRKVIKPIIKRERKGGDAYDNDELVEALRREYPNEVVLMYQDFETISI